MKYNLGFWQKLQLPLLWIYWKLSVMENKKSWHEVKKGMEKHEHKFSKPFTEQGFKFLQCDHEGCNLCEPVD